MAHNYLQSARSIKVKTYSTLNERDEQHLKFRHSGAGRSPDFPTVSRCKNWIPVFTGMTVDIALSSSIKTMHENLKSE